MNRSQKSFSLFLILWTGQLLSRIGSGISAFALGIYLFQQTGSTSAYSKASGLIQLAEASRYLVSPVIAGVLLTKFSLPLVLVIDLMTFVVGAMTVILIRNMSIQHCHEGEKEGFLKDFTDGIIYIVRNKTIFHLLCLTSVVTFLTGILQVLLVPIVLSFTDAATLGTVQSIAASGMLVSSVFIGILSKTDNQYKVLSWSLGAAGLFYLLIGTSTNTVLFTATAFCFFLTLPFVNTSLEVLFRQNITNEMQGRIWSLISLISQIGMLVALSSAGVLADRLFNPLLTDTGCFAKTVGSVIGTGSARGSGLMVIISGFFLVLYSLFIIKKGRDSKTFDSTNCAALS
jgi:DHA3 family macrolide efflux protein-like MFS transporter